MLEPTGSRLLAGALAGLTAALAVAGFVLSSDEAPGATGDEPATVEPADPDAWKGLPGGRLLVRAVDEVVPRMDGPLYELSAGGRARRAGELTCKRVHASLSGLGLCFSLREDGMTYEGVVFDRGFKPRRRFAVQGVPDRTRVSPDGRYGAFTVYDLGSGEGYFADAAQFSTSTGVVDMRTGRKLLDLESQLQVTRDGRRFAPTVVQFWGVTFGEGGRFYATMATGVSHFLVEGSVGTRRARVIGKGIECPSLSPDGKRIAYKRRIKFTNQWRLHVLDLATREDVRLAEPRSIDDQPEWWGDDTIVYSDDRTLYAVPADGSGEPRRLADRAASPAAVD